MREPNEGAWRIASQPWRHDALDISKDIRSLTDFKRETPKFLDELKATGGAVVLTVNGEA